MLDARRVATIPERCRMGVALQSFRVRGTVDPDYVMAMEHVQNGGMNSPRHHRREVRR